MECMEKYLMNDLLKDIVWMRYVDDVFCVVNENFDFETSLIL